MATSSLTFAFPLLLAGTLVAQSNAIPGVDITMYNIGSEADYGRRGPAYPNGEAGFVIGHSFCNAGTVPVVWEDRNPDNSMADTYPKIAFLLARESDGRMVQVSGRSYVKHSGTPFNFSSGPCAPCQSSPSAHLRVGCSDTYGPGFNGNRNNLGPAEEINPWLGTWDSVGSYFDRGDPAVGGSAAGDNFKSLDSSMTGSFDAIKNRITCRETELAVTGAQFYGQCQIVIQGEPGDNRANNQISRPLDIAYNGVDWDMSLLGSAAVGSVLENWSGATSDIARNGDDDGHFRVAVKVTPTGTGSLALRVRGAERRQPPRRRDAAHPDRGGRDGDQRRLPRHRRRRLQRLDLLAVLRPRSPSRPAWSNAIDWNNFYNFWFDCSEAPSSGLVSIDQARPGPGAASVDVFSQVPSGIPFATATPIGSGCGDCAAADYEFFATASAFDLQNSSMTLAFDGTNYTVQPGTSSFLPASGTTLAMTLDDEEVQALPFSLPFPGGATNAIVICSNGFVSPGFGNGTDFTPSVGEFLGGQPRWAAAWHDFNVPNGGTVQVDASGDPVVVTFTDVVAFSGGGLHTFQYQFDADGDVHILWGNISPSGSEYPRRLDPGRRRVRSGQQRLLGRPVDAAHPVRRAHRRVVPQRQRAADPRHVDRSRDARHPAGHDPRRDAAVLPARRAAGRPEHHRHAGLRALRGRSLDGLRLHQPGLQRHAAAGDPERPEPRRPHGGQPGLHVQPAAHAAGADLVERHGAVLGAAVRRAGPAAHAAAGAGSGL